MEKMAKALSELKKAAFRNAIRLFRDACILTITGSAESAYALAILAYEEIGKTAIVDRQLDRICLNAGSEEYVEADLLNLIRNHRTKQGWAYRDTNSTLNNELLNLDLEKQAALYTDCINLAVQIPTVPKHKLKAMLQEVYRALNEIGDLPYSGITAESNKKTILLASSDIESIRAHFEKAISI